MQIRTLLSVVVLVFVTTASSALADEKLDAVQKEIAKKWQDVKSMTAKITAVSEIKRGDMTMTSTMKSEVEFLVKDGKTLSRLEGENDVVQKMGEKEQTFTMPILSITDGEFTHTLMEQMGRKMCVKNNIEPQSMVGAAMLKALREQQDLTVADDEDLDGEKCWVIHATPKKPGRPGEPVKTTYYIRQKDGVTVQMLGLDDPGDQIMTAKYSDIKLNQELDPQRFVFKVPEGVQVMDMTKRPEPPKAP